MFKNGNLKECIQVYELTLGNLVRESSLVQDSYLELKTAKEEVNAK